MEFRIFPSKPRNFSFGAISLIQLFLSVLLHFGGAQSKQKEYGVKSELKPSEQCQEPGYFGSTTDCNVFYRCVPDHLRNETLTEFAFECPPGLIFDTKINSCNREEAVEPKPICYNVNSSGSRPQRPQNYPNKFVLTGSKFGFVYFKYNLSSEAPEEVESVELDNVIVDPFILTNYLALTTNLRSLVMRDVELISDFEDRVHLSHLQEFYLSHVNILKIPNLGPIMFKPDEKSQIEDFRTYPSMFLPLIFFYKDSWNLKIKDISSLRTNIDVLLYGVQLLRLRWREGLVESRLIFTDEIISNWMGAGPLQKLIIRDIPLNTLSVPTTLRHINFENVFYGNGSFADVFRKNRGLNSIRIAFSPKQIEMSKVYLSDVPKRIENLMIVRGNVVKSVTNPNTPFPIGSYERYVEFQHLESLSIENCELEAQVIQDFALVFKTGKVQVISTDPRQHHPLLKQILLIRDKVTLIEMSGFGRNPNPQPIEYTEIESFLNTTGVKPHQTSFVLEKKDGSWVGRGLYFWK